MEDRTPAISQTAGIPAQINLEDFVEAVSKGVMRALQAENDVSGFAAQSPYTFKGPMVFG